MRGVETRIQEIRHKIFTEVARMAYHTEWPVDKRIEELPYKIIPGEVGNFRNDVFLERAIVGERLRLAMGLPCRNASEHAPVSDNIEAADRAETYYTPPLINVIKFACNACKEKRVHVTDGCQGCLAHPCVEVCPKGAVTLDRTTGRSHIDEDKCNGCGLCATACHEGAIDIINGKAKLVRENFCDGFGDCLPGCPTGAITFEEREAPAYDEAAVQENKKKKELQEKMKHLHEGGCPGSRMRMLEQTEAAESAASAPVQPVSRLRNWPVQIKLAPVHAPYFAGAKLLIAADCTAYAYANFHQEFMRGKVTLIGCPKLDAVDYSEKLTEILRSNDIQSVTILRMEVPCCGGLEMAAKKALQASGKFIPWQVVTISIDGKILD